MMMILEMGDTSNYVFLTVNKIFFSCKTVFSDELPGLRGFFGRKNIINYYSYLYCRMRKVLVGAHTS